VMVKLAAVGIWFHICGAAEDKARLPESAFTAHRHSLLCRALYSLVKCYEAIAIAATVKTHIFQLTEW